MNPKQIQTILELAKFVATSPVAQQAFEILIQEMVNIHTKLEEHENKLKEGADNKFCCEFATTRKHVR
jgi:hypothetical protein